MKSLCYVYNHTMTLREDLYMKPAQVVITQLSTSTSTTIVYTTIPTSVVDEPSVLVAHGVSLLDDADQRPREAASRPWSETPCGPRSRGTDATPSTSDARTSAGSRSARQTPRSPIQTSSRTAQSGKWLNTSGSGTYL